MIVNFDSNLVILIVNDSNFSENNRDKFFCSNLITPIALSFSMSQDLSINSIPT